MARGRDDRPAGGAEIGSICHEAGVNLVVIWDIRAAKVESVVLTGDRLPLQGRLGLAPSGRRQDERKENRGKRAF